MPRFLACLFVLCVGAASLGAAPPARLSYQGRVKLSGGAMVPDSTGNTLFFRICSDAACSSPLWNENWSGNVTTTAGLFTVQLGTYSSLTVVPFSQPLWLEITVNNDPNGPMLPRLPLAAAPYAFYAAQAGGVAVPLTMTGTAANGQELLSVYQNQVSGGGAAIYAQTGASATAAVIGYSTYTTTPNPNGTASSGVAGKGAIGVSGQNMIPAGFGVAGTVDATGNTSSAGVFAANNGAGVGLSAQGPVGVYANGVTGTVTQTNSTTGTALVVTNNNIAGARAILSNGDAIFGGPTSSITFTAGVTFSGPVYGIDNAITVPLSLAQSSGSATMNVTNSFTTPGGVAIAASVSGNNPAITGNGQSGAGISGSSTSSYGVYGAVSNTSSGVFGTNLGFGDAISGIADGSGSGVYGYSAAGPGMFANVSNSAEGLYAENTGTGNGVYASAASGVGALGSSTTGVGVEGSVSNSAAALYGYNSGGGPGVQAYSSYGTAAYFSAGAGASALVSYGNAVFGSAGNSITFTAGVTFSGPVYGIDNAITAPLSLSQNAASATFSSVNNGAGAGVMATVSNSAESILAANNGSGSGIEGTSASGTAIDGVSTSGIGIEGTSSSSIGVEGAVNNNSSGVVGQNSGIGAGVYGLSTSGYGVEATSGSSYGVYATNNSGSSATVYGANTGTGYGVEGTSPGVGIYGQSGGTAGGEGYNSGTGYGLWGNAPSGTGVYGSNSGGLYAVQGSNSGNGYGVYGVSTSGIGVYGSTSAANAGVMGQAAGSAGSAGVFAANTGSGYGLEASSGTSGFAIFANNESPTAGGAALYLEGPMASGYTAVTLSAGTTVTDNAYAGRVYWTGPASLTLPFTVSDSYVTPNSVVHLTFYNLTTAYQAYSVTVPPAGGSFLVIGSSSTLTFNAASNLDGFSFRIENLQ